ncbi:MAG: GNAT family N-acetyltransferase [Desulfovibrio sp.]|nr:GNAT family N-acetyltransferase [Desulfovibrio sp.]
MNTLSFRLAVAEDAPFLARCITDVSAGVVDFLLEGLLPSVNVLQILTMVMRDTSSFFSHKNCVLAEKNGQNVGLLFAYPARDQTIPALMKAMIPSKRLQPLLDVLTASVPDSLHINTLWVDASYRGSGLSDALLDYASEWAKQQGFCKLGLFVWTDNKRALSFYVRHSFTYVRSVAIPKSLADKHGRGDLLCCEL